MPKRIIPMGVVRSLTARGPFDSPFFYEDLTIDLEDFCFILVQVWLADFFVFKSLDNNMVYSLGIDVYLYERNRSTTKVLWVLQF